MNDRIRQTLVIIFAIGQWLTAGLIASTFFEFNEITNSESTVSESDYFIPSNGTFAVWGLIYSGATVYAVYQALPAQRERALHRRVGGWLALNYALCCLWNVVSVQSGQPGTPDFQPAWIGGTVVIIVGMLIALTQVWISLREMNVDLARRDRWLAQAPAAFYFAWINVAVIANTTSLLMAYGINGEPYGVLWSTGMIVVATLLTSLMILYSKASLGTLAYTSVVVWALVGIYIGNNAESVLVGASALLAACVVTLVTALHWINQRGMPLLVRRAAA